MRLIEPLPRALQEQAQVLASQEGIVDQTELIVLKRQLEASERRVCHLQEEVAGVNRLQVILFG